VANDAPANAASVTELAEHASRLTAVPLIGGVLAACVLQAGWPLSLAGALSLFVTLFMLAQRERPRSWLPTLVTAARGALTCLLIARGPSWSGPAIAAGIFVVFTLDGLDGLLARRLNSVSVLGERLDMETDALLVMGACLLLVLERELGWWALTSGLLRYAYVLVMWISGARGEAPRSSWGRYAFGSSLSLLTLGFLAPDGARSLGPALATAILLASFGRSFYWSFRGDSVRKSQSKSTSEPSEK